MLSVRSILCPVDFSEQSRQALRWAAAVAESRGAQLTVLSVVEPLLAHAAAIRLGVDLTHADTAPALREFVETTVPEYVRQATRVRMEVAVGNAADAILQGARERHAELIVMGTHGRGGLRKLILGSTAEQVLRQAQAAVLVVPMSAVGASAHADHADQAEHVDHADHAGRAAEVPYPHEQRHHGRIEPTPTPG